MRSVETSEIAATLEPFALSETQLRQVAVHIELLLKWNARMNLTSVRDPGQIVSRHVGESLFAARALFPNPDAGGTLADVGSGAGFPGLPIAIYRPGLQVGLVEAHGKKATFLREVIRSTGLGNVRVEQVRAERYEQQADVVTLRAVEEFASVLRFSAGIVKPGGRLACLIGEAQVAHCEEVMGRGWNWGPAVYFPDSSRRVLWIAHRGSAEQ